MTTISSLNLPEAARQSFNKNFLHSVVIEFRFPTLLEIAESLPTELQKQARPLFPHYNKAHVTNLTPHGSDHELAHEFVSKSKKERLRLNQSSLSITFYDYKSYESFKKLVLSALNVFVPYLETNFFTRVGLRYINNINTPNIRAELSEWINTSLVGYISDGSIQRLNELKMEVGGDIDEVSKFHFRCGLMPKSSDNDPIASDKVTFLLDYDYYAEDVEVDDAEQLMDKYHDVNFNFFWWSLGDKAREDLLNA